MKSGAVRVSHKTDERNRFSLRIILHGKPASRVGLIWALIGIPLWFWSFDSRMAPGALPICVAGFVMAAMILVSHRDKPVIEWDRPSGCGPSMWIPAMGSCGVLAGMVVGSTMMVAVIWTAILSCLWRGAFPHIPAGTWITILTLTCLGFPWVESQFHGLGWWFRLVGAGALEMLYSVIGFEVNRQGTLVHIEGAPVSVEEACSGMASLQTMILAGVFFLRERLQSWRSLVLWLIAIVVLSCVANTMRILVITFCILTFGVQISSGLLHDLIGLGCMAAIFRVLLTFTERPGSQYNAPACRTGRMMPWTLRARETGE